MVKHGAWLKLAGCISIVCVGVIAYLPAVDNFFISDDFPLLTFLKTLNERPLYILEWPSELFRVASYIYFWSCMQLFGMNPEPYYWTGIALHILVSLLVCTVVLKVSGRWLAAWAAGLFFAGYERHQEAVMWISAANDTILTLNFLVALLLWRRYLPQAAQSWRGTLTFFVALAMFALTLFSKEGAVAFGPLAILGLVLEGANWRAAIRRCLPLLLMTVAYGCIWLSQSHKNFFVTNGLYAFTPQFFPVYARALIRLAVPTLFFLIPLLVVVYRANPRNGFGGVRRWFSEFAKDQSLVFFAVLLAISIVPYSFLTYQNHIPSRNTYLPSVGLAGLAGILLMTLHRNTTSAWGRRASIALLLTVVSLNVVYIWTKKEPQFRARSAPTLELIGILNGTESDIERNSPITVCGFPLDPWIGREAVVGFTRLKADDIRFLDVCGDSVTNALRWEEGRGHYAASSKAELAQGKE